MEMRLLWRIVARLAITMVVPGPWIAVHARQDAPKTDKKAASTLHTKPTPKPDLSRAAVLSILEEATRSATALRDARSKAEMFAAIAAVRARVGDREAARTAFRKAIQAADAIDDARNRIYTLENIAAGQIDSDDRPSALATMRHASEAIDAMGNEFQRITARSWIVRTIARAGDVDAALKMALDLPGQHLFIKAQAMGNVLEGLKPSGLPAMKKALPALLRAAATVGSPPFEADCLRGFAQVLADTGDIEDLRTIIGILEKGAAEYRPVDARGMHIINAEIPALSALAKAQAGAGHRDAAVETFQRALELARAMPAEGEALRSGRLERLAYERVEAGDVDGALQMAELIVYEYHKAAALIRIAEARAKAGHRDEARALFDRAIRTAHEIKVRDLLRDREKSFYLNQAECIRTIAYVQARAGFAEAALQTAETIDEPRWKNSALRMIAMAMARRGDVQPAIELAEKVGDEKTREEALQAIAEARAEAGDMPGALEWARNRPTPESRANALLGIMKAIAKGPAAAD
jgi:tetratricopeptide (TPR) repeat protein